jgi:hypothetical protein
MALAAADVYNLTKSLKSRNWHAYCSRDVTARALFLLDLLLTYWAQRQAHAARRRRSGGLLFSSFEVTDAFLDLPSGTALGTATRHSEYLSLSLPLSLLSSRLLGVDIARMVELVRGVSRG